jgi:hypothetical protein
VCIRKVKVVNSDGIAGGPVVGSEFGFAFEEGSRLAEGGGAGRALPHSGAFQSTADDRLA